MIYSGQSTPCWHGLALPKMASNSTRQRLLCKLHDVHFSESAAAAKGCRSVRPGRWLRTVFSRCAPVARLVARPAPAVCSFRATVVFPRPISPPAGRSTVVLSVATASLPARRRPCRKLPGPCPGHCGRASHPAAWPVEMWCAALVASLARVERSVFHRAWAVFPGRCSIVRPVTVVAPAWPIARPRRSAWLPIH